MSDTTYNVNIDYVGQDKTAVAAGDRVADGLVRIQGHLGMVNAGLGMVTGAMERIALGVGASVFTAATLGARALVGQVVRLGSNAEDTSLALGAMLGANGATGSWAESMQMSQRAMSQIRADAAALPGEAQDYINIFRGGLAGMLQSGLDVNGAVQMADRVGAVAAMLQVDSQQASRDLALMLGGRAGAQVRLWTAIQAQVGKTSHEFNALGATQRRVLLDHALDRYSDAIGASGRTWSALTGTVKTFAEDSIRAFGGPFYDLAKHRLEGLVGYLSTHGTEVTRQLERWGVRGAVAIDRMYDRGMVFVGFMRTHWREAIDDATTRARQMVSVYGALQGARLAMSGGSAVAGLLGGGGGGAAAAVAGAGGVAVLGAAAAAAAVGIGAMTVAINDGSFDWRGAMAGIRPQAEELTMRLGELWQVTQPVVSMYGGLLLTNLTKLSEGVLTVANVMVRVNTVLMTVVSAVLRLLPHLPGGLITPESGGYVGWTNIDRDPREGADGTVPRVSPTSRPGGSPRPRPASPAGHTTIINHFRIEEADNPERVALTVQHVLERELRHPTQAAMPGNMRFSGR